MSTITAHTSTDRKRNGSAAQRIYHALRERIADMNMLPGERIVERDIAIEFDTSRTPVHEAVQRLAEEGMIEVVPRSGTFVARIPLDSLEEAMLVRCALEAAIIENLTKRVTPAGMAKLNAILEAQAVCMNANDIRGFHRTDENFHAALANLSGYPGVWTIILKAKTQIDRYRQLTLPLAGRMGSVMAEHRSVVTALASGDSDKAAQAMRTHLDQVLLVLETTRKLRPEYFKLHFDEKPKGA